MISVKYTTISDSNKKTQNDRHYVKYNLGHTACTAITQDRNHHGDYERFAARQRELERESVKGFNSHFFMVVTHRRENVVK